MLRDPLSNLLARLCVSIRNKNTKFNFPNIKSCIPLLDVLYQNGYIRGYVRSNRTITIFLRVLLNPLFTIVVRISKPGCRKYCNVTSLLSFKKDVIYLLSTPKGILTHAQAISANCGGEVLCMFY